jgi:starch phosphorylase
MMKASMKMSLKMFSSHRMVSDYMTSAYKPAMRDHELFSANGGQLAVDTVNRRRAIASRWDTVHLGAPTTDRDISDVHVGDAFNVKVNVHLGEINPDDVKVEVFYGELSPTSDISNSRVQEMTIAEHLGNGDYVFTCTVHCRHAGRFGYTARVQPRGDEWRGLMPGYIAWADWKE